jgi:RNA polymerase sigma-70 factor (ECF subfamily)
MADEASERDDLLVRARGGDAGARAELFARYRGRLRQLVRLRLDRRLSGRLDPSDVVQEAYLDFDRRFAEYAAHPEQPFFLWLRFVTVQRLIDLHRHHLGTQRRDAAREMPEASVESLADELLGKLTSPTQAAMRSEMQARLQEALNALDPLDREVLVLRHFEELSNAEAAAVLGIQPAAASKRYVRALARLRDILDAVPGFFE